MKLWVPSLTHLSQVLHTCSHTLGRESREELLSYIANSRPDPKLCKTLLTKQKVEEMGQRVRCLIHNYQDMSLVP